MPVKFEPEKESKMQEVPFFEDVSKRDGFIGHGTDKSEATLLAEISNAVAQLGGAVVSAQRGKFTDDSKNTRDGYEFIISLTGPGGRGSARAKIQAASLPIRNPTPAKQKNAIKMALYVLRDWLIVSRNFGICTPSNVAVLIPFMLDKKGETFSSSYLNGTGIALPAPVSASADDDEIIDAE